MFNPAASPMDNNNIQFDLRELIRAAEMSGINGGYDTRQMATGDTTNDIPIIDPQTVLFQQVAINAEAKSNQWGFSAYGLITVGEYGYGSDNSKD